MKFPLKEQKRKRENVALLTMRVASGKIANVVVRKLQQYP